MTTEPASPTRRPPQRIWSTLARRAVVVPLALLLIGFFGLWIIGPKPIRSGPYLQAVTTSAAVVARIDRTEKIVRLRFWPTSDQSAAREMVEAEPTRFHALQIDGLTARTEYGYVLEDLDATGKVLASDAGSFHTAPAENNATVRFAAVGDTGRTPWWFRNFHRFGWMRARPLFAALGGLRRQWDVARAMVAKQPDFMLHLGDVVYPDGRLSFFEEAFFLPFDQLLRTTPSYLALGNHDTGTDGGQPYQDVFHLPGDSASGSELYYTFSWGVARIVVLNSQGDTTAGSPMMKWLEATLTAATEPWTVVAMHHPIFCSSRYADHERLKQELWPTLAKHRIDLLLSGHSHGYQRFQEIEGVTPVIAGGGGHSIYETVPDPRLAAHDDDYGFLMVEATETTLTGELLSPEGERRDHFVLQR